LYGGSQTHPKKNKKKKNNNNNNNNNKGKVTPKQAYVAVRGPGG
jgi:hypothetical protein